MIKMVLEKQVVVALLFVLLCVGWVVAAPTTEENFSNTHCNKIITFGDGIIPANIIPDAGCDPNTQMTLSQKCLVKCKTGYVPPEYIGAYECPSQGGDPTTSLVCTPERNPLPRVNIKEMMIDVFAGDDAVDALKEKAFDWTEGEPPGDYCPPCSSEHYETCTVYRPEKHGSKVHLPKYETKYVYWGNGPDSCTTVSAVVPTKTGLLDKMILTGATTTGYGVLALLASVAGVAMTGFAVVPGAAVAMLGPFVYAVVFSYDVYSVQKRETDYIHHSGRLNSHILPKMEWEQTTSYMHKFLESGLDPDYLPKSKTGIRNLNLTCTARWAMCDEKMVRWARELDIDEEKKDELTAEASKSEYPDMHPGTCVATNKFMQSLKRRLQTEQILDRIKVIKASSRGRPPVCVRQWPSRFREAWADAIMTQGHHWDTSFWIVDESVLLREEAKMWLDVATNAMEYRYDLLTDTLSSFMEERLDTPPADDDPVSSFLEKHGLSQYTSRFAEHGITPSGLMQSTEIQQEVINMNKIKMKPAHFAKLRSVVKQQCVV